MAFPVKIDTQTTADEPTLELRRYYEWVSAEKEALYQFACVANELGFEVDPGSYQRNRSPIILKAIGQVFTEQSSPEVAVIAQHHGIPTRLLDWSSNPMVAAFFAVTPLFRASASKKVCVWALDTGHLTFQGPDQKTFGQFQVLIRRPPRSTNQFLHSQGGVLTEITNQSALTNHFLTHQSWPTLEYVIALVKSERPILVSYTLDFKHADHLLTLLDREGINHAALMLSWFNGNRTFELFMINHYERRKVHAKEAS